MLKQSSNSFVWFSARIPDFYFYIIGIISIIVAISCIKTFMKVKRSKNEDINKNDSLIILVGGILLLVLLTIELIWRIFAYWSVLPAFTFYAYEFYIFTTVVFALMMGVWIFKSIKNGMFISWKNEWNSYRFVNKIKNQDADETEISLGAPADGQVKNIVKVKDDVFSKKIMGDGFVVTPNDGNIYSPMDGTLETVFRTKHAYGIRGPKGEAILLHLGIDTVKLDGKGFTSLVKEGQKVKKGEKIAEMNLEIIKKAGYSEDVLMIVLPESPKKMSSCTRTGKVVHDEEVAVISTKFNVEEDVVKTAPFKAKVVKKS